MLTTAEWFQINDQSTALSTQMPCFGMQVKQEFCVVVSKTVITIYVSPVKKPQNVI